MDQKETLTPVDRHRRVQVLKKIILVGVPSVILFLLVMCIMLTVWVCRLQIRINNLEAGIESEQNILSADGTLSGDRAGVPDKEPAETVTDTVDENQDSNDDSAVDENFPDEDDVNGDRDETQTGESDVSGEETSRKEPSRKVYLTFDDGPSSNTDEILDILAEYGVKATFFVTGRTGDAAEAALKRIVEEGHTIALHSYTHKYSQIYASIDAYSADLTMLHDYVWAVTGVDCTFVRFPGGSSNTVSKVDMRDCIEYLHDEGYVYFDWNVSSGDAQGQKLSAEKIADNCISGIQAHENCIVLLHDASTKDTTVEALPMVIEAILKMDDTELLPITEDTVPVCHIAITYEETEDL